MIDTMAKAFYLPMGDSFSFEFTQSPRPRISIPQSPRKAGFTRPRVVAM